VAKYFALGLHLDCPRFDWIPMAHIWHIYCKKTHCKKTTQLVTSCKFEYTLALLLTTCSNTKKWHVSPFGTFSSLLVWWSTPQPWCCLHLKILLMKSLERRDE